MAVLDVCPFRMEHADEFQRYPACFLNRTFAPGLFNTAEGAENISIPGLIMMGILYIVLIYFSFIFTIRRLHDRNHTGWLSLLMLVPLVNLF